MMRMRIVRLSGVLIGSLMLMSGTVLAKGKTNDFPTRARADYVFACMAANKPNQEFLRKCSCAVDTIASRIDYSEYEAAETVLTLQLANTPNAATYSSPEIAKPILDPY